MTTAHFLGKPIKALIFKALRGGFKDFPQSYPQKF
jgi:hypothetical protein